MEALIQQQQAPRRGRKRTGSRPPRPEPSAPWAGPGAPGGAEGEAAPAAGRPLDPMALKSGAEEGGGESLDQILKSVADSSAASMRTPCPLIEPEDWQTPPEDDEEEDGEDGGGGGGDPERANKRRRRRRARECPRCTNADVIGDVPNPVWNEVDDIFKRDYGRISDITLAETIRAKVRHHCSDEGVPDDLKIDWNPECIFEHYKHHMKPFDAVVNMDINKSLNAIRTVMEENQLCSIDSKGKKVIDLSALEKYMKLLKVLESRMGL